MPEKTVREMSENERKHYSLEARVFHATLLANVILGVIALLVGLGIYAFTLSEQLISQSFRVARSATVSVFHGADAPSIAEAVMDVYYSLSEEELAGTGTEEYRSLYPELRGTVNFETLKNILLGFMNTVNVDDVYLAMYDRERSAMVYMVDPDNDPETVCEPGDWESVDRTEMERFLSWNGEGLLYDIGNTEKYGWLCTSCYPMRDENGTIYAFVLVDVNMENVFNGMKSFALQFSLTVFFFTALIAVVQSRRMKKDVVTPINAIAAAAQDYVNDRKAGAMVTDHFSLLNIRTGDEIENLSFVMADMERDLSEYMESLTSVTAEKERIATELNLASNIQAHMLPNTFPAFPERPEFEIFASMTPAKEVGGDFYDFFMVDENHLGLVMADVSGKGVPAALFMMASRTMLKDAAFSHLDPAAVLERVNAQLCENNPEYMFVTVWLGILETSTGKLTWADAGHEQLLLYQNGEWTLLPKGGGVALAAFEPELLALDPVSPFQNHELLLKPGDAVYQYTDGVTEAMTAQREQFGYDRLLEAVNSAPSVEPEVLLPHVRKRIDAFVQDAPQFDDITMLALRYRGRKVEG